MARQQQPHYGGYFPPPFIVELEAHDRHRPGAMISSHDVPVFEMPGESAALKTKEERQSQPPAQLAEAAKPITANPWPFYLEDTATAYRSEVGRKTGLGKVAVEDSGDAGPGPAQQLANPWPYHGPPSPTDDQTSNQAHFHVGDLDIASTQPSGADGVSEAAVAASTKDTEPTSGTEEEDQLSTRPQIEHGKLSNTSSEADQGAEDSVSVALYPPPLKISRPQRVSATPPPTYKPYCPPTEDKPAAASPSPKRRNSVSTTSGHNGGTNVLPFRPYRPISPPVVGRASATSPQMTTQVPLKEGDAVLLAPSAPHTLPVASSPAPARPTTAPPVSGASSTVVVPDSPHRTSSSVEANLKGSSDGSSSKDSLATTAIPVSGQHTPSDFPPDAPPMHPDGAAPHRVYGSPAAKPPSPSASTPQPGSSPQPTSPTPVIGAENGKTLPASVSHHSTQYTVSPHASSTNPPNAAPMAGHSFYGPPPLPPSGPGSGPYPGIGTPQPQSPSRIFHYSPLPALSPVPSMISQVQYSPSPHPGSPQVMSPPPPPRPSGYDIPQPLYAPSVASQSPRPQFPHAPTASNQSPQMSPQSPPPPYSYPNSPSSGTQSPPGPSPFSHPSPYHMPPGPAVAPHQHNYPAQPTYATPGGSFSPPISSSGQYAPPLPPRPATVFGNQPPSFSGFGSGPQHAVSYPPPPKKQYNAQPPPRPPTNSSGGRLFSSSSALKWLDKTSAVLENKLDAVLQGPQGPPHRPAYVPIQPPRQQPPYHYNPQQSTPEAYPEGSSDARRGTRNPPGPAWR